MWQQAQKSPNDSLPSFGYRFFFSPFFKLITAVFRLIQNRKKLKVIIVASCLFSTWQDPKSTCQQLDMCSTRSSIFNFFFTDVCHGWVPCSFYPPSMSPSHSSSPNTSLRSKTSKLSYPFMLWKPLLKKTPQRAQRKLCPQKTRWRWRPKSYHSHLSHLMKTIFHSFPNCSKYMPILGTHCQETHSLQYQGFSEKEGIHFQPLFIFLAN